VTSPRRAASAAAFDLRALLQEIEHAPPAPPLPWPVAVAVVSDTFRLAGHAPPPPRAWEGWRRKMPRAEELLAALAQLLVATTLRAQSVRVLEAGAVAPKEAVASFLDRVSPLNGELVRANRFRREEFLRQWAAACAGAIAGETAAESKKRLEQLDYRQALAEYKKAESARRAEAARRAQLLREAREREEQAKGWRE
jgi:hypothetical protein